MLILGSNSPRRRQLLAFGGWTFRVVATALDESPLQGEAPLEVVLRLAIGKARATAEAMKETTWTGDDMIVSADTAVVADGTVLGKPSTAEEAMNMLRRLRGGSHQVYTAVAIYRPLNSLWLADWCLTEVTMRNYSDEEISEYIASGDPFDKAGGYAIQHPTFRPVERLKGCYANVMGLPVCHLTRTLIKAGIPPQKDVPRLCQSTLGYKCPVYREILQSVDS